MKARAFGRGAAALSLCLGGIVAGAAAPFGGAAGIIPTASVPSLTVSVPTVPPAPTALPIVTAAPTPTVTTPLVTTPVTLPVVTTTAVTVPVTTPTVQVEPPAAPAPSPPAATQRSLSPTAQPAHGATGTPAATPSPNRVTPFSSPSAASAARTSRTSSLTIATAKNHEHGRARSVSLLLRLPRAARIRITLTGPSPRCATALTVTARAHTGLNHLHVTSTKIRRLKAGRYLIKVLVPHRQKPLLAAVVITTRHRVAPIHQATSLAKRCSEQASSSMAGSSGGGGGPGSPTTPTPNRAADHHGLGAFPGGVTKALDTVGRGADRVAASGAHLAIFGNYVWALVVYFIVATLMLVVIGAVLQALRT